MNRQIKLFILVALSLLLTGCWDAMPVEDRNIVLAVGVDYLPDAPHYLITFVAPIIAEQRTQPARVQSFRATGLAEALAMAGHADGQIYSFGKLLAVVFGENAARQGVSTALNDLFMHPNLRIQSYVTVALGTAHQLLTVVLPEGQSVDIYLKDMLDRAKIRRDAPPIALDRFTSSMVTPGIDASTPLLAAIGTTDPRPLEQRGADGGRGIMFEDIQIVGKAAWQGDRMVGTMTLTELQYLSIAQGTSHDLSMQVLLPPNTPFTPENNRLIISLEKTKSSWQTQVIDGKFHFNLKTETVLSLTNYQGKIDLTKEENAEKLAEILATVIKQGITKSLQDLFSFGSDPIGLGQMVRVKHPLAWDAKTWTEALKKATYSVSVKIQIRNIGLTITRFEPKGKNP
ncbi:MAG: Spore germination protein B3 [Firmicutes bacterium]|nr:Spore germination protein B3 [Bacillota bacterium]